MRPFVTIFVSLISCFSDYLLFDKIIDYRRLRLILYIINYYIVIVVIARVSRVLQSTISTVTTITITTTTYCYYYSSVDSSVVSV